jgi:hypothetical protein
MRNERSGGRLSRYSVPRPSAEHIVVAQPVLMRVVLFAGLIGLAMVVAGVVLVWLGASGNSEIEILGAMLKTANVGLGSVFADSYSVYLHFGI